MAWRLMAETILAVDDDPGILLVIRTVLEGAGYRVFTAADGEEARGRLDQCPERFCAILLDWDMPRLTGIDLMRWIKEQPHLQSIPVVMETAMDSPEQIRTGIDAGAFYYLTKPFETGVLLSIVNAALEEFRYRTTFTKMLQDCGNPFRTLMDGRFRFRTLDEGERLALWIANACPDPEDAALIVEIMTNAVEHGNLGIGYDEKTVLVEKGTWRREVERRLALPESAGKHVDVQVTRNPENLEVLVEDTGPGFDFAKYLVFDESRAFDNHGRGIVMAGMAMQLEYLGKGNRVHVTIPLC
jgi:DNA-binding response OmpR family regulator